MVYGGYRSIEQFLAIPVATQNAATHSGGIVDLDRNYGGTALRYFGTFGGLRLAAGLEYDLMNEKRKGFINNNGVGGALKRDEDNKVDQHGLLRPGRVVVRAELGAARRLAPQQRALQLGRPLHRRRQPQRQRREDLPRHYAARRAAVPRQRD